MLAVEGEDVEVGGVAGESVVVEPLLGWVGWELDADAVFVEVAGEYAGDVGVGVGELEEAQGLRR